MNSFETDYYISKLCVGLRRSPERSSEARTLDRKPSMKIWDAFWGNLKDLFLEAKKRYWIRHVLRAISWDAPENRPGANRNGEDGKNECLRESPKKKQPQQKWDTFFPSGPKNKSWTIISTPHLQKTHIAILLYRAVLNTVTVFQTTTVESVMDLTV